MIMPLIALGVTGGIGAYKAVEVARGLQKRGHDVAAIMTRSARQFVGEVTFEAITRRRVITDQFARGANADIEHIALATDIALLLVAPATANVIGKFANGIADDFLSSLYLATRAPVLMAPAMNTNMLEHDAVRRNLATLSARGVRFVDPGAGLPRVRLDRQGPARRARGHRRGGRTAAAAARLAARPARRRDRRADLRGHRRGALHRQPIERQDGVRGRRRGGAPRRARGAGVRPVAARRPRPASSWSRVRSAHEMQAAVQQHAADADIVVMAAAVADYTPDGAGATGKIEKADAPLDLRLVPTPDILADLGRARGAGATPVLVGFAAESGDPVATRPREAASASGVDLIVANDISRSDAGFDAETNAVVIISAERRRSAARSRRSPRSPPRSWTARSESSRTAEAQPAPARDGSPRRTSPLLPGARRDGRQPRREVAPARRRGWRS